MDENAPAPDATSPDTVTSPGELGDTTDQGTFSADDAIAALTSVFQEALAAIMTSADSQTYLPELSAPNGNGVAYDKFLTIYESAHNDASSIIAIV